MAEPIAIAEARGLVLEAVRPLPAEPVALSEALGRVLAEDVTSEIAVPPFDSSAMDGYAVVAGPAAELRVLGESRAGHPAAIGLEPDADAAIAISTGAAVPQGATAVVPVERTEPGGPGAVRVPGDRARRQRAPRGRGRARRRPGAPRGRRAGPRRAGRGRFGGPRPRCVRAAAAGRRAGDGRRADGAGRAARARPDLRLERLRAGRAGRARGRRARAARAGRRQRRGHARGGRAGARGAPTWWCVSGGVSVGPHDHVKDAFDAARRATELLGRARCVRASRSGSARATTRWCSGCRATRCRRWSPSSCSCARPCAALQGADPAADACDRDARASRWPATRAAEQAVRVPPAPRRRRVAGIAHDGRARARTCSPRCWAPTRSR